MAITGARYGTELEKYSAEHPEPRATIGDVADHIEHLRKVAGVDHLGIGSDFYGAHAQMSIGLEDTSRYPVLFAELIRRGWSDEELINLARGNLLRACVPRNGRQPSSSRRVHRPTAPSKRSITDDRSLTSIEEGSHRAGTGEQVVAE